MGLFNVEISKKQAKDMTLIQIAESKFGSDNALMNEIRLFLRSCRQARFYPTKVSFLAQCEMLEKVPVINRVQVVHNSVLKGYRQMAYDNSYAKFTTSESISRKKVDKDKIRKDVSF